MILLLGAVFRFIWRVDSVKSTVTVLEEGDFSEEGGGFNWRGYLSVGGYHFLWRSAFRSRGGGHTSGGGGHTSLGEGWILISRRGSTSSGVGGGGGHTFAGGSRRGVF